jgi:hypothetical protein
MIGHLLQEKLEATSGMKLKLKINNNRSTMLSVRWGPEYDCAKVSLHSMFLKAPQNVMQALACYLKGKEKSLAPSVKAFIEDNVKQLDYSHLLDQSKLTCQGSCYNLQTIYNEINKEYFKDSLKLNITWFGKFKQRNRSRITFGLYYDPLKLIKIHRLLDAPSFPHYLISYVVYHEMLHHVCPSYIDATGMHRIHSREFKEQEVQFRYYKLAQDWIKEHKEYLFAEI